MIDNSQKGVALLTTLLIGVLALALISAILTFMIFGKHTSFHEEKYRNTLEAAKGGAYYIMRKLDTLCPLIDCKNGTYASKGCFCIKCYNHSNTSKECWCNDVSINGTKCSDGTQVDRIDLGDYKDLPAADGGTFHIEAILNYRKEVSDGDIYSITINATKEGSPENSVIDFIYKAPKP